MAPLPPLRPDPAFWSGKRVLVTGHTGFKGGWLVRWLAAMCADVTGLALPPEGEPNLFALAGIAGACRSRFVDLRDTPALRSAVAEARPEIGLHLAAQALVRRSYRDPAETFSTNVQGSVNLLEALADAPDLRTLLVVTSDKVYRNDETGRAFVENDPLGGHDPYSLSKAACEHAVAAWRASRYAARGVALATVRGGNVIGGGDFSEDRIVPDIVRAAGSGRPLVLRSPDATRPWQHVLDCLSGYLVYAERLTRDPAAPTALNVGPDPGADPTVADIAERLLPALGAAEPWQLDPAAAGAPKEMARLSLDPSLARSLGIRDRLPGTLALDWTAEWYAGWRQGEPAEALVDRQIERYSTVDAAI